MSREIKFRVWNTTAKCMYPKDHFALTLDGRELQLMPSGGYYENPGNMIYMQFTGLSDKNGKEIYEGDLVEQRNYIKELLGTYEVRSEAWSFTLHDPKKPEVTSHYIIPDQLEVIGNIYEASNV